MRCVSTFISVAAMLASSSAFATVSVTVPVSGEVESAIGVSLDLPLAMPKLVAGSSNIQTGVTVACDSSGATSATFDAHSETSDGSAGVQCATLSLSGIPNLGYSYSVTVAVSSGTDNPDIALNTANCTSGEGNDGNFSTNVSTGNSTFSSDGTDKLYCGGKVTSYGSNTSAYDDIEFIVTITYG